jgi:hypothetical protein
MGSAGSAGGGTTGAEAASEAAAGGAPVVATSFAAGWPPHMAAESSAAATSSASPARTAVAARAANATTSSHRVGAISWDCAKRGKKKTGQFIATCLRHPSSRLRDGRRRHLALILKVARTPACARAVACVAKRCQYLCLLVVYGGAARSPRHEPDMVSSSSSEIRPSLSRSACVRNCVTSVPMRLFWSGSYQPWQFEQPHRLNLRSVPEWRHRTCGRALRR